MSEEVQAQAELSTPQDAEFPVKQNLVGKIKSWRQGLGQRWARLHTNQIIYVIALCLLFIADGNLEELNTSLWYVGVLAFFGMARELWSIFIKVWESTFGRLVLLVIYAAIANFTLAVAAQKVNAVIGADPTQLYHTLGVTTLLVLPLWLMVFSVVGMIAIFGLLQILRLFHGLLTFMRIIGRKTQPKEAFPKTFIIVRLILLAPVAMTMVTLLNWYGDQLNLPNTSGLNFYHSSGALVENNMTNLGIDLIEKELQSNTLSEQERAELMAAKQSLLKNAASEVAVSEVPNDPKPNDELLQDNNNEEVIPPDNTDSPKVYFLDKVIAAFVYNYETFSHSHCQKESNERVVYISENDILVAKQDTSSPTGFAFSTRSCVVGD